jgi:riboflavin synthase
VFTGLVTAVGTVRAARRTATGLSLRIAAPYRGLKKGESVAVDGACLTVVRRGAGWFAVEIVPDTLRRTLFADYGVGRRVNLERALRASDRLGGHLVQGHVDGIGTVRGLRREDGQARLELAVPAEVGRGTIPLGSITVDGVSLTVGDMPQPGTVQVSLIPFTIQQTTLGAKRPGDRVHLEADLVGKYVAALNAKAGS